MSTHQLNPFGAEGERHVIDTPEQTSLQFPVAGVGSRFLAMLIDSLIQGVVGVVVGIAFAMLVSLIPGNGGGGGGAAKPVDEATAALWGVAVITFFFFALHFGYFALFEIFWGGQTPGKRAVGIRVIKDSGRPLTPSETIARNLLRIVDQLPTMYAVGMVTALLNPRNKRVGDFVAGSIVVRENSAADVRPSWTAPTQATQSPSAVGAERLTTDDLNLIEAFLSRRYELQDEVRYRMAVQILERLQPKLPPQDRNASPETILETLAYVKRASGGFAT